MKKQLAKTLTLAIALGITSCGPDDTSDITINNYYNGGGSGSTPTPPSDAIRLAGNYKEDLTLDASKSYVLSGALVMQKGATLTIPAGTVIKANEGQGIYIAILQGAKIMAKGTADKPIVLTSSSAQPKAGKWGGLVIVGNAPITSAANPKTDHSTAEVGGFSYGGDDPTDNSGVIQYVRIEYAGYPINPNSEFNSFTFYSVGSGTTVDHIQAYEGADDGVEFFGGTVKVSNFVAVNCFDDSIDWTEGFSGSITDAYVQFGDKDHDHGVEADGYNADVGNNSNPKFFSNPTITNLTIKGLGSSQEIDGKTIDAIRLRVGTKGKFNNVKISGVKLAVRVDAGSSETKDTSDAINPTGQNVEDGTLHFNKVTFDDVAAKLENNTSVTFSEGNIFSDIGKGTGTDIAVWGTGWTVGIN